MPVQTVTVKVCFTSRGPTEGQQMEFYCCNFIDVEKEDSVMMSNMELHYMSF